MTVQTLQQPRLTKGHNLLRSTTCGKVTYLTTVIIWTWKLGGIKCHYSESL